MVPNYITLSDMGLVDSIYGVALPQLADATGIFLLRQSQERAVSLRPFSITKTMEAVWDIILRSMERMSSPS